MMYGSATVANIIRRKFADRLLVGEGRDRRHLGDQPDRADLDVIGVVRVGRRLVEGRQRGDGRGEDAHRVGVHRESIEEALELLVEQGVLADLVLPVGQLGRRRQLAVDQQVGGLEERRLLGQLLDRVAAVAQDSGVTVEERDGAPGRGGVAEAVVERRQVSFLQEGRDVDRVLSVDGLLDRQAQDLVPDPQLCGGGRGVEHGSGHRDLVTFLGRAHEVSCVGHSPADLPTVRAGAVPG
jgi:hypothetical protein